MPISWKAPYAEVFFGFHGVHERGFSQEGWFSLYAWVSSGAERASGFTYQWLLEVMDRLEVLCVLGS